MKHPIAVLLLVLAVAPAGCRRAPASEDHEAMPSGGKPGPVSARPLEGIAGGGGRFALSDLRGSPVVLIFYRGAFCGICVQRLSAAERHRAAYEAAGARLVAVTPQPPDSARATRSHLKLHFPLVSAAPATLRRWGVWRPGESAPRPGEFVVDARGRLRFQHVGRTAADRVSDETLLGVVRSLSAPSAPRR